MTDKEQLEWLWSNCRIVYFPTNGVGVYPIEHQPFAHKDSRDMIEQHMTINTLTNSKKQNFLVNSEKLMAAQKRFGYSGVTMEPAGASDFPSDIDENMSKEDIDKIFFDSLDKLKQSINKLVEKQ